MGWSRFGAARRRKHEESESASRAGRKYVVAGAVAALAASTLAVTALAQAVPSTATSPPFVIDGNVPDGGEATTIPAFQDGFGNAQELGPINASRTKLGVIHDAAVPMLGQTNPNAQVDLRKIWLDTAKDVDEESDDFGDTWLYLGWERDSNKGSGVIMYEFMKGQPPTNCVYDDTKTDAELIESCNPWSTRDEGDFVLVWDQVGSTIKIIMRTWTEVDGKLVLGAGVDLTANQNAFAATGSNGFRGEAKVNLSNTIFNTASSGCVSYGNIVPGTVTGNSDTADYKDTVLEDFGDVNISNCGKVTVEKETIPAGESDTFDYTLARTSGDDIRYESDDYEGAELVEAEGTLTEDGDSDEIPDLIAGNDYTLTESLANATQDWENTAVECVHDGTTYSLLGADADEAFPVVAGETTACVITNTLLKASPQLTTVQSWTLHDTATVTGIRAGGTPTASVRFRLYDGPDCTGTLIGTETDNSISSTGGASTTTGINVTVPTTYYWEVRYSGDSQNNPYTTCDEVTSITAKDAVNNNWVPNP